MTINRAQYKQKYRKEIALSHVQPPGPFPFIFVLDHLKAGYNVGKIIRSANVFGCREVLIVGLKLFDPNPAKGALKHTKTRDFDDFASTHDYLRQEGYSIFALDPRAGQTVGTANLPEKSAFVMGHEERGFSFRFSDFPDVQRLRIHQVGIVESLNVSVAASIVAYDYVRQRHLSP